MFSRISLVGFGLIMAAGAGVTAQQFVPPESSLKFVEVWRPTTVTGPTQIIGTVIDIRQAPVANVKVRLRNLRTGKIEMETQSDDQGNYAFELVEPGSYVVEMVMVDGTIIALSNAGALARYETLQTVVQLPGRWNVVDRNVEMVQKVSDFVGLSSALTMTATTLNMAIEQNITPLIRRAGFSLTAPHAERITAGAISRAGASQSGRGLPATPEPHLFDRLRCSTATGGPRSGVLAVVAWVMADSYTRLPIYRATARVLIEDANNDIATPSEISRPVNMVDPEIYMQTQLRIIRGRDLSQRVAKKLDLDKVAEFNGQGPKPTQLARGIATVKYYAMWPYRLITSSSSAPPVLPPSADDEAQAIGSAR